MVAAIAVAGVLLATAAVALLVLRPGAREPETHVFTVPAGARAALRAGEGEAYFPRRLVVTEGDELVIHNRDSSPHEVGPYTVGAHQTVELRFGDAGVMIGNCTLHPAGKVEIVVKEA